MPRFTSSALVVLAALVVGCGGGGNGFFATVPPPVELTGGGTRLIELPTAGIYRGDVLIEHVTATKNEEGEWVQTAIPTGSRTRAEGIVDSSAKIDLRFDGALENLFSGTLSLSSTTPKKTLVDLTAFDGHKEVFPFTLVDGSPMTLKITARGQIIQTGQTFEFNRYAFELRP